MKNFITVFVFLALIISGCGQKSENQNTTSQNSGNNSSTNTNPNTTQNTTPGNTQQNSNTTNETSQKSVEETSKKPESTNTENQKRTNDGAIRITFPVGATEVSLNGKITGFADQITYVFEASKGQKLNSSVMPIPKNGNIRISQIISPSGNADGPFGNNMSYNLNESGDWKIVLSENQMAGDSWEGEYKLTVKIQ
ncbi:MAG TPA: hypothetical protein PLG90_00535 [Ignavibacteria bacterium]|nr:hypothetical protein [Ignavibacteria bacterium]